MDRSQGHKLTIIGGGSSMFVPTLLRRILASPTMKGGTVCLMDIDEQRLRTMAALARALIAAESSDLRVESTNDQRASLSGADFVIVAISVGGMAAWASDIEIPARYGVFMQIADSFGPSGMMRAFRNAPVLASISRDLAEVSPEAWVFNYTNPAAAMLMALQRTPSVRSVSLCSCTYLSASREWLGYISGLPAESFVVPTIVGGINHCAAVLQLRLDDGRDALPLIRAHTEDPFVKFAYDAYGVLPYCFNHWAEFYPQLQYLDEPYTGRAQGLRMKYGMRIYDMDEQAARMRQWEELADRWSRPEHAAEVSLANLPAGPEDLGIEVMDVIDALSRNQNSMVVVNTRNEGCIGNLPFDGIVEVNAVVNAYGIHPLRTGPIPEPWATHLRQHITVQRLTVEAALSGDRRTALNAFVHDPLIAARLRPEQAESLLDEMLAANQSFLPQFARSG